MAEVDKYGNKIDDTRFRRPPSKEEIKYRKIKRLTFEKELQKVLPEDCTLCFHGTTIWNTKKILMSQNISAEIDRIGKSEDVLDKSGKIYVTTIHKVWFTIRHFSDLGNYNYPAGCIFVIAPKNEEEITSSKEQNVIGNVYFDKNPERLKFIITTPENINCVKMWVKESGLDISNDVVVDYDEFITIAQNNFEKVQTF